MSFDRFTIKLYGSDSKVLRSFTSKYQEVTSTEVTVEWPDSRVPIYEPVLYALISSDTKTIDITKTVTIDGLSNNKREMTWLFIPTAEDNNFYAITLTNINSVSSITFTTT